MSVLAVSDLHIGGPDDPLYASLLALLRERAREGDTVVLAGDLFDLFVGHKRIFLERYEEFFRALRDAGARGVKVHYIEGNHDFLLHSVFHDIPGVELHLSSFSFKQDGKSFFFAHGDLADRADYGYRVLRAFFRSPVMRAFVKAAPGALIDGIGRRSSRYSRGTKPVMAAELPPDARERLRKAYRSYAAEKVAEGHDFVVMGHCHDLDEMDFTVAGRRGQYVNIGFPRVHGSYLEWNAGDARISRTKLPG